MKLNLNELLALSNPIIKDYVIDSNEGYWTIDDNSRLIISNDLKHRNNDILENYIKIFNAETLEKNIINSPLKMLYSSSFSKSDIFIELNELEFNNIKNSNEAYKIVISIDGILIKSKSDIGVFYALRTIQNMLILNDKIPYGEIFDFPDMKERRLHIDIGRKFFSKDWIIQIIREMSYIKLNTLQIHFSENHGFRIECDTDPNIVSKKHLKKSEIKDIISESKKYGIQIIPSFDTPGHVDQILRIHPEFGQVDINGNHYKSGLDITNSDAVSYIKKLYSEYMDLFKDSKHFHIGGDEYMEFDKSSFINNYKKVLDDYAKISLGREYSWKDSLANYINDIADFVYQRGFIPRVWNDGLYYGEKDNFENPQKIKMHDFIEVDYWSQMPWNPAISDLNTIINKGHKNIYNSNSGFFYYVLRPEKPSDGRLQHSFDNLNADKKIYNEWTPGKFANNTIADDSKYIKGVSMSIWCDLADIASEDTITKDIYNEIRAMACKSWNYNSNSICPFEQFKEIYNKLGNVAGFEKGKKLPNVGSFIKD